MALTLIVAFPPKHWIGVVSVDEACSAVGCVIVPFPLEVQPLTSVIVTE